VTSQLPWPSWMLAPSAWPSTQRLLARCLDLASHHELPSTLMLVGEPGLGREAFAVELAAGLAVHGGPPAGCTCAACQRVRRGIHPDVEIIVPEQGKSDISILQAQQVAASVDQRPYEGRQRVVVFSSCQTPPLNTEAASALLKTLEEPPAHLVFLLLAANPERVLPTIQSRSVQIRIPPPDRAAAEALVAAACGTDPSRAAALLEACHGNAAIALAAGDPAVGAARRLATLLPAVLWGDGAALLQTAGLVGGTPGGLALAVVTLLGAARSLPDEQAERALAAAAALLASEHRCVALRLDHETAVLGALTPFATGAC